MVEPQPDSALAASSSGLPTAAAMLALVEATLRGVRVDAPGLRVVTLNSLLDRDLGPDSLSRMELMLRIDLVRSARPAGPVPTRAHADHLPAGRPRTSQRRRATGYFFGYGTGLGVHRTDDRRSFFAFDVPALPADTAITVVVPKLRLPFGGPVFGNGPGLRGLLFGWPLLMVA